jgi:hypothetical protein
MVSFSKFTKVRPTFIAIKSCVSILTKNGLGYILGNFLKIRILRILIVLSFDSKFEFHNSYCISSEPGRRHATRRIPSSQMAFSLNSVKFNKNSRFKVCQFHLKLMQFSPTQICGRHLWYYQSVVLRRIIPTFEQWAMQEGIYCMYRCR